MRDLGTAAARVHEDRYMYRSLPLPLNCLQMSGAWTLASGITRYVPPFEGVGINSQLFQGDILNCVEAGPISAIVEGKHLHLGTVFARAGVVLAT